MSGIDGPGTFYQSTWEGHYTHVQSATMTDDLTHWLASEQPVTEAEARAVVSALMDDEADESERWARWLPCELCAVSGVPPRLQDRDAWWGEHPTHEAAHEWLPEVADDFAAEFVAACAAQAADLAQRLGWRADA